MLHKTTFLVIHSRIHLTRNKNYKSKEKENIAINRTLVLKGKRIYKRFRNIRGVGDKITKYSLGEKCSKRTLEKCSRKKERKGK